MAVLRFGALPEEALAAASRFHAEVLPEVRDLLAELGGTAWSPSRLREGLGVGQSSANPAVPPIRQRPTPDPSRKREGGSSVGSGREMPGSLTLVFPPADHTHRAWRLAVVQGLAREYAPIRVSALASDDEVAITAAHSYLEQADGVTGQLLLLDGFGAGEVIHSQP